MESGRMVTHYGGRMSDSSNWGSGEVTVATAVVEREAMLEAMATDSSDCSTREWQ